MHFFQKRDWRRFFSKLYKKVMEETELFGMAAQIAFFLSSSLFPLLFFLISLLGLILESTRGFQAELYSYIAQIMPPSAYQLVRDTLDEIVDNSSGSKLTFGLLITLWTASAGVDSIRAGLNSVYEQRESRPYWWTKLQSLLLTLLFIILIAITLVVVAAGWQLVQLGFERLGIEVTSPLILVGIQWLTVILVLLFVTAVIYSVLPCFKKFKWVWISPGAVVAIILWLGLTNGFRIYLQYFDSYNKTYGSLGAMIILMLWMYLSGVAILIGGSINSVLTEISEEDKEEGDVASLINDEESPRST
jgi:membrane protein